MIFPGAKYSKNIPFLGRAEFIKIMSLYQFQLAAIAFIIGLAFTGGQELPAMIANGFTLPPIGAGLGNPVALETWSLGSSDRLSSRFLKYTGTFVDCSDTASTLCNQGAWADFGLAISGLTPKYGLCTKYSPSTSCVSTSLAHCNGTMSEITNTMMIAFGRVVVSWCYDGGMRLTALDTYATCLSVAMFDSLTIRNCLTQITDPTAVGKPVVSNDLTDPQKSSFSLPKLFNNVLDTYQSSTIICMHSAINEACGEEAATLALGPAMDELMVLSTSVLSTTTSPAPHKNYSLDERKDIFSKSRQLIDKDFLSTGAITQFNISCFVITLCLHFIYYINQ